MGQGITTAGLEKRYGLPTAVAMVSGIVIGSGVFFKAEKILNETGGNLPLGILAWLIGGAIMMVCAYTFSIMAAKYEYVSGVVDYAEVSVGKGYAYYVGWFLAVIYYPSLTSVLSWISARYFCSLLGFASDGPECLTIAGFFLITSFVVNALSPAVAGKFQVGTTVIKLIPLFLMAIFGTVSGLRSGMTLYNFTHVVTEVDRGSALFTAVVASSFAYEGWIIAASINAELKDSRRTLPRALLIGTGLVAISYILYYLGLAGAVTNETMMENGEAAVFHAFNRVFSGVGGIALSLFVVISCLGTLNGLMLGCSRGLYALAARGEGPRPDLFSRIDSVTGMPVNSAIAGLFFSGFWLLYFYGANLTQSWFGPFSFDTSELPIIAIYASYIPIFLMLMKKERDLPAFKRFFMPALAILGCLFMMTAACFSHGWTVVYYLMVLGLFLLMGLIFNSRT